MFRRLFSIAVWIGIFGIGSGSCLEKPSFGEKTRFLRLSTIMGWHRGYGIWSMPTTGDLCRYEYNSEKRIIPVFDPDYPSPSGMLQRTYPLAPGHWEDSRRKRNSVSR